MKAQIYSLVHTQLWPFFAGFVLVLGCSKDEGGHTILFDYSSQAYEIQFNSEVTIPPPTIEWPGAKGTFNLKKPIKGLEIDEATGEISITGTLDIGEHQATVIAKNNQNSWETHISITSTFKNANLGGGQNNDTNSDDIEFSRLVWLYGDNTLKIELFGDPESTGVGVWTLEGDVFKMYACLYCGDMDPTAVPNSDEHSYYEGIVTNNDDGAFISGQWFVVRFDPDSTTLRGNFFFGWD